MEVLVLLEEVALLVGAHRGRGCECSHPIAHAERPLVAQQLHGHRRAVKGPCHDLEAPEPAFRGTLRQARVYGKQLQEVPREEDVLHLSVKLGALGRKAIGTVGRELVAQVAGGNVDDPSAKLVSNPLDALAQTIVNRWRATRDSHAHHLGA